jgi:hypothetical protein
VACFKPFKITFRKEKVAIMININYIEPNKIALAGWVKKSIDQSLTKKNVISGFKVGGIWQLILGAMYGKIIPNSLYLINNTHREKNADSISNKEDEKEDNDIQWINNMLQQN